MSFDEKLMTQLSKLSRIECTEEERKKLFKGIQSTLEYVKLLDEIDTRDVPPCNHVLESLVSVMRNDEVKDLLDRETFLENAPSHTAGMVRVPPVIKF